MRRHDNDVRAGLQRGVLDLAADLGEILQRPVHALLHRLDRLRALVQAEEPGEDGQEYGRLRVKEDRPQRRQLPCDK